MVFPLVTGDNRFDNYPTDDRFPTPFVDTRFDGYPLDARFPSPGSDTRFGEGGGGIGLPLPPSGTVPDYSFNFGDPANYDAFLYKGGPGTYLNSAGKLVWNGHNIIPNSEDQGPWTTNSIVRDGLIDGFWQATSTGGTSFPRIEEVPVGPHGSYWVEAEFNRPTGGATQSILRAGWDNGIGAAENGAVRYFWDTDTYDTLGNNPPAVYEVENLTADIVRMRFLIEDGTLSVFNIYPAWSDNTVGLIARYRNVTIYRAELPIGSTQDRYVPTDTTLAGTLRGPHYAKGTAKGVQLENIAAENILPLSNLLGDIAFAGGNTVPKVVDLSSPVGTEATQITPGSATTNFPFFANSSTEIPITGVPWCYSIYAKAGTHKFIQISFNSSGTYAVNVDLETGEFNQIAGISAKFSIERLNDGWWRVALASQPTQASHVPAVGMCESLNSGRREAWVHGDTESVFFCAHQFELGAAEVEDTMPTSYIPTGELASQRIAETLALPTAFTFPIPGVTVQMQGEVSYGPTTSNKTPWEWRAADTERLDILVNTSSFRWRTRMSSGGSNTAADTSWSTNPAYEPDYLVPYNTASRFSPTNVAAQLANAQFVSVDGTTWPDASTFGDMQLANDGYAGSIAGLQIWDEALDDRDLIALGDGMDIGAPILPPSGTAPVKWWNYLDYDRLPPDHTFTRTSTATYMGADGTLKTAGVDEPRFEYDSDGNALGLLIEPEGENRIFNSVTTQGVGWSDGGVDVSNAKGGPAGDYTIIAESTGLSAHGLTVTSGIGSSIDSDAVRSFYAKAGTHHILQVDTNSTSGFFFNADLRTGEMGIVTGFTSVKMEAVGDGWWRFEVVQPLSTNDGRTPTFYFGESLTSPRRPQYQGTGKTLLIAAPQFEWASNATSYIPTLGDASETRAPDRCTANISAVDLTTEGTLYGHVFSRDLASYGLGTVTDVNSAAIARSIGVDNTTWRVYGGGPDSFVHFSAPFEDGDTQQYAYRYVTGATTAANQGVVNTTPKDALVPGDQKDIITIGGHATELNRSINGHMKSVQLWDTALSDRDLTVLTGGEDPGVELPTAGLIGAYDLTDQETVTIEDGRANNITGGWGFDASPVVSASTIEYDEELDCAVCEDNNSGTSGISGNATYSGNAYSIFMAIEFVSGTEGASGNCGYAHASSATSAGDSNSVGYLNGIPQNEVGSRVMKNVAAPSVTIPDGAHYDVMTIAGSSISEGDAGDADVTVYAYNKDMGDHSATGKRETTVGLAPTKVLFGRGRRTGHGTRIYGAVYYDRELSAAEAAQVMDFLKFHFDT